MVDRKGIVLVKIDFIQRKKYRRTNVTLHAFQQVADLKIFPKWLPRACSWTTLH